MPSRGRPKYDDQLTHTEWKVADAVRHGLSNPAIASRLGVTTDAVKFHVSNILTKLGFTTRKQLRQWSGIRKGSAMPTTSQPKATSLRQLARTVGSVAQSRQWYCETLGLQHLYTFGNLSFLDCFGVRLMLQEASKLDGDSIFYVGVEGIHAFCETLIAKGATIVSAPHMIHKHDDGTEEWLAFVEDPDGRPIGLMEAVKP
jgi:DNA-binding CsgD family transcriptional regulator/catechol 2,3-dioxygenase-like lactoylglutathione lyase family enzyme